MRRTFSLEWNYCALRRRIHRAVRIVGIAACAGALVPCTTHAQEPVGSTEKTQKVDSSVSSDGVFVSREGNIEVWRVNDGNLLKIRLKLTAKEEPKPALSITLIPNAYDRKEGNAAIFYLQAMGFFEQRGALKRRWEFEEKYVELSKKEGQGVDKYPPYSWLETSPDKLPTQEVKQYLSSFDFQPRYLEQASMRKHCDFDRRIQEVENPAYLLIPEVQQMRDLARTQSIRFKLAVAENRFDDAVKITGQQMAICEHLSQEPFLVSTLVGIACAQIGLSDSFYLAEHADAPNLYWALASLPNPLSDVNYALAYERNFLFEQIKILREVDDVPRHESYWKQFAERFTAAMKGIGGDWDAVEQYGSAGVALAIASGYPGAVKYLTEVEGFSPEKLKDLPKTQVFFLATRKYYERARDDNFKRTLVPYSQLQTVGKQLPNKSLELDVYGWIGFPANLFLPAIDAVHVAKSRLQQVIALRQSIESLRHHLATNKGQWPESLQELQLPAPNDPATDKPFVYQKTPGGAKLTAQKFPGIQYVVELTN